MGRRGRLLSQAGLANIVGMHLGDGSVYERVEPLGYSDTLLRGAQTGLPPVCWLVRWQPLLLCLVRCSMRRVPW
jgi:hypothetical protein